MATPRSKSLRFIGQIVADGCAIVGMLTVFTDLEREILNEL